MYERLCKHWDNNRNALWERNIYGGRKRSIRQGDVKEIYNKTGTVLQRDSNEPIFRKKPERSKNNRKRTEREKGAKGEAFEKFRGNLRTRCVNFISRNMQRWRPCKFNDHFSHSIRSFPKYWMFVHGANLTSNLIKPIYLSQFCWKVWFISVDDLPDLLEICINYTFIFSLGRKPNLNRVQIKFSSLTLIPFFPDGLFSYG